MKPTTPRSRLVRASTLAAACLLAATACGGDDDTETATDDSSGSGAGSSFPLTVTDQYGDVEITEAPERVVTSGNFETDIALDLGVEPVAVGEFSTFPDGTPPWRTPLLPDPAPPLIAYNVDGYDIEETLSFEPDLVLNSFLADNEHQALNDQVPTVAAEYGLPMGELVTLLGRVLGRTEEAAALNERADAELAAAREAHPGFEGTTIALGYSFESGLVANYTDPGTAGFLTSLGFEALANLDNEDFESFNVEQISQFDADVVIIQYSSPELQEVIEASPLFQALTAVEEGRYLGTSEPGYFDLLRPGSPAAMTYAIEEILPDVAELVDG